MQAIELKQQTYSTLPQLDIPKPEYDARLMTKPPSRRSNRDEIKELLSPYVARGLHLTFGDEQWFMTCGKKSDQGTMRMPLRVVLRCARKVME